MAARRFMFSPSYFQCGFCRPCLASLAGNARPSVAPEACLSFFSFIVARTSPTFIDYTSVSAVIDRFLGPETRAARRYDRTVPQPPLRGELLFSGTGTTQLDSSLVLIWRFI